MRQWWTAGLALAALLAAVGVPQGREMEELSLITALAADRAGRGVEVTAVTGVRAAEDQEPEVLTGAGADLEQACQAVQEARASHAYLGQADKLLLGEDLARSGLMETLEFVLDHRELRLDTFIYIVKGDAGQGLADTAPAMAGETPGRDPRGVTVGQALSKLCQGEAVRVPALQAGEDGRLKNSGWALLEPWGLCSYPGEDLTAAAWGEEGGSNG